MGFELRVWFAELGFIDIVEDMENLIISSNGKDIGFGIGYGKRKISVANEFLMD